MRTVFVSESESELKAARDGLEEEMNRRRPGMPAAVNQALDAPLDARVVLGHADQVSDRLREDRERLGIDLLIVRPSLAGVEPEACKASLQTLAEEIWPDIIA